MLTKSQLTSTCRALGPAQESWPELKTLRLPSWSSERSDFTSKALGKDKDLDSVSFGMDLMTTCKVFGYRIIEIFMLEKTSQVIKSNQVTSLVNKGDNNGKRFPFSHFWSVHMIRAQVPQKPCTITPQARNEWHLCVHAQSSPKLSKNCQHRKNLCRSRFYYNPHLILLATHSLPSFT